MDFLIAPDEDPDPMGAVIVEKDMPNPFRGGYYGHHSTSPIVGADNIGMTLLYGDISTGYWLSISASLHHLN